MRFHSEWRLDYYNFYGKFINGQAEVNISTRMRGKSKQDQYCEEIKAIIDRQGNIIKILDE